MNVPSPIRITLLALSVGCSPSSPDPGPSALVAYAVDPAVYLVGKPIAPNPLSSVGAFGGFAVIPPLPGGLLLDPDDGTISGTPVESAERRIYLVSAQGEVQTYALELELEVRALSADGRPVMASTDSAGAAADEDCERLALSADGSLLAFTSAAADLDPSDGFGSLDLFICRLDTGSLTRLPELSEQCTGDLALDGSGAQLVLSALGDLEAGADGNGDPDVYLRRADGALECISRGVLGFAGDGPSDQPSISPDGRFVAFRSQATDLLGAGSDPGGMADVFVRDLASDTLELASVGLGGAASDGPSGEPAQAGLLSITAFTSEASNLVPGDSNGVADVFLRVVLPAGVFSETVRASVTSAGAQADGPSGRPSISETGQFVAFESDATNLVDGDTNGSRDVFVFNRLTGVTERVSVDSHGGEAHGASGNPAISPDGRYVAFESDAPDLVVGDVEGTTDVFVHDRLTGETLRLSQSPEGLGGSSASRAPALARSSSTGAGPVAGFLSRASEFDGPTGGVQQAFVVGPEAAAAAAH
jgi:Tol biopolymer transport system component